MYSDGPCAIAYTKVTATALIKELVLKQRTLMSIPTEASSTCKMHDRGKHMHRPITVRNKITNNIRTCKMDN